MEAAKVKLVGARFLVGEKRRKFSPSRLSSLNEGGPLEGSSVRELRTHTEGGGRPLYPLC